MGASIVLTGLAANDPVPGVYTEINFAQGPSTGFGGQRAILVLANKSTAGSATVNTTVYGPDTAVPLQTENDMITLGGPGSEAHRMYRRIAAINTVTPVYWVFVTESAGAAATLTVTLTTNAPAAGNLRIWVGDDFVDTAIASADTVTTIAANAVININAKTNWAVTATSSVGVITITAKNKGLRGNWLTGMAMVTMNNASPTTVTPTADTFFTGGTTADSNATALTTILPKRYYYIISAAEDATQLGALASQVATQALPTTGIRQKCFAGSADTLANVNTVATGINSPRAEITWLQQSNWTPSELAANAGALYALLENSGSRPRNNYSMFPVTPTDSALWKVPAPRNAAVAPTRANIKSALSNGVTPINVLGSGATQLAKRITTRSLSGATNDYRIRDAHKVTICDFFADDLQTKVSLEFGGKDLADDPAPGSPQPGPQIVTPRLVKGAIFKLISEYGENYLLVNVATIKAGTIVQRETNPTTRTSALIPLQTVDIADQWALSLNQVA